MLLILPVQAQADAAPTASPLAQEATESGIDDGSPIERLSDGFSRASAGQPDVVDGQIHVRHEGERDTSPLASSLTAPHAGTGKYIARVARGRGANAVAAELRTEGVDAEVLTKTAFQMIIVEPGPGDLRIVDDHPGVAQIWEDKTVRVTTDQASPPWGLDRIDQGSLPLDNKFSYDSDGTGVTAYVVDTGTRGTHQDFGGRVTSGWNGTGDPGGGNSDCHGHGTHVAGTVAGATYGVAKNATIVPIRVLTCSGAGDFSTVIQGIEWAITHHQAGTPAVMNMSLGGGAYDPIDAAVASAVADGIVVVAAAGNSNTDACTSSPARAPTAITVGATDSADAKASFSNFGSCLDIWAPGVGVASAYRTSDTSVTTMSGTSMAAPHVAGAVARLLSANSALTVNEVTAIITSDVVNVEDRNILQSPLYADDSVPPTVAGFAATPRNGAALISWSALPADAPGIILQVNGGAEILKPRTVTQYVAYGLTNGQTVSVTARAVGSRGTGATATVTVTPVDDGTPDRPTISRVGSGNEWLNVEVNFPSVPTGGAVSSVSVTATPATGSAVTTSVNVPVGTTTILVKVTGLVNQTAYTLTATATNGSGASSPSLSTAASPSTATQVSGTWSSTSLSYPTESRAPMVVDESRGVVWAGAINRSIVAVDIETRLASTGTLPAGTGMWLLEHAATGRVFAVPNRSGNSIYELGISGSSVTATVVATPGFTMYAATIDPATSEIIVVGASVGRYSVGSSGNLTALTVPSMSMGSDIATAVSVSATQVAMSSNLGGWVKLWNRSSGSVATATGFTRPGTVFAYADGVLLVPTNNGPFHRISWAGSTTASLDLDLPIYSGGTFNGWSYPHRYADIVAFDASNVGILMSDVIISLNLAAMTVNKIGGTGMGDNVSLSSGASGLLLAGGWLMDIDVDLKSRWKDYAFGSISEGPLTNAARRAIAETTAGALWVETASGFGVRVVERASAPIRPIVESANGNARVTWTAPTHITDKVEQSLDSEYKLRPVTYDIVLNPGNIVRPWRAGALDVVIDGLDPDTTYTAVVRSRSPGGITDSEPITFTPSTTSSRPAAPSNVQVTPSGEGCATVTWNAVAAASGGYRVELSGRTAANTVGAGVTTSETCGLVAQFGIFPKVSARVTSLAQGGESVPTPWSAHALPTLLPSMEGVPNRVVASKTLGITVATTFSVAASEAQSRRTELVVMDDQTMRTLPLTHGSPEIIGIDDVRREVLIGHCNVVSGGISAFSLDTLARRDIELPGSNQWEFCNAGFDPSLRAVWLAPTLYSSDDNFDTNGTAIVAVSVDTPGKVVATSNLTCQPGTWTGEIYVAASPRFTIDSGRVFASCMALESGSKPTYSVVTDAMTGTIIATNTGWLAAVGATPAGDAITVKDASLTIHTSTPTVVTFGTSLGYDATAIGRPTYEDDARAGRMYARSGSTVTVIPNSGPTYIYDITAGTLGVLLGSASLRSYGLLLAAGNGTVGVNDSSVAVTSTTAQFTVDSPTTLTSYASVTRTGQQIGVWGYGMSPLGIQWSGPDSMHVVGRMRVPDNLGTPTDEAFHSVVFTVRAPAAASITSRTSASVAWALPSGTAGIAGGTQRRWELRLPGGIKTVRDATGAVRCVTSGYSCTSSPNFADGAVIESLSLASMTSPLLAAPPTYGGVAAPAAPVLTPWRDATAGTVAVRVGLLGADSTAWEVSCASEGDTVSATGSAPGLASMNGGPGFWTCRSRGVRGSITGAWGQPVIVHSRPLSAATTGLTGGNGAISMAAGSNSFSCRRGTSTVSGTAGQSVAAATGQWLCWVTLADTSTVPESVVVHSAPAAASSVALVSLAGRAVLSYVLPDSATTSDESTVVTCTGAHPYSGTVNGISVDIGAATAGSTTCTVVRSYWTVHATIAASTASASVTATFAASRRVSFTQVGNGTVTVSVTALSRASAGSSSTYVEDGTTITFTAVPAAGWTIGTWSVDGCAGSTCTIAASADIMVQVGFSAVPATTAPITSTPPTTSVPPPTSTIPTTVPRPGPVISTNRYSKTLVSTASRITARSAMLRIRISAPAGAKTTVSVSSRYAKVCRVSGTTIIRMSTRSTCVATVTMTGTTLRKIVTLTIRRPG